MTLTGCSTIADSYDRADSCQRVQVSDYGGFDYKQVNGKLEVSIRPAETSQPQYCGAAKSRYIVRDAQGRFIGSVAK